MIKLKILNHLNKEFIEDLKVDEVFSEAPDMHIVKSVIDHNLFERMLGTNKTKNLSEVSGSGKKPFKQKGTGRARQGTSRSALMVGGYTAIAPRGDIRKKSLNKKVKARGLLYALNDKIQANELFLVDGFSDSVKTKDFIDLLKTFDLNNNKKVLFIDDKIKESFAKSSRNIINKNVLSVEGLNVYDIVKHDVIVVSKSAFLLIQALLLKRLIS